MATRDDDGLMGAGGPAVGSTPVSNEADAQAAEERRLQARRRFLKGGVAGSTAVILTLHHVPTEANWTDGDWSKKYDDKKYDDKYTKKKQSSVMCDEPTWTRKRGVSICTSLNGQVAKKKTW